MNKSAPLVIQMSDTECGVAALAMIFAYYGLHIPFEQLRDRCGASRDGCKAQVLIDTAKYYGFTADAYTVEVDIIKQIKSPLIAYWGFSHYVVINKIRKDKVYINDPGQGKIILDLNQFSRLFTGVVINISPNSSFIKSKTTFNNVNTIKSYYVNYKIELLFITICAFIINLIPYLNSAINNIYINQRTLSGNSQLTATILFITSLTFTTLILATFLYKKMLRKLLDAISHKKIAAIFIHLLHLPMHFYALRQRNEICAIISRAEMLVDTMLKNNITLLSSALSCAACLTIMLTLDTHLTSYYIGLISLFILATLILNRSLSTQQKLSTHTHSKFHSYTASAIKNIETIYMCGLKENTFKKRQDLFRKYYSYQEKITALSIANKTTNKLYHLLSIFILLGAETAQTENIIPGKLITYYAMHIIFYSNISKCIRALIEVTNCRPQSTRIHDVLAYKKDARYQQASELKNIPSASTAISCHHVSFYYNHHSNPILNNITMHISKGQHVALIGSTGSGKSTLAKLLCGLHTPSTGKIILFDKNLNDIPNNILAKTCAYVSQDTALFTGTILENLTLWQNNISNQAINEAIQICCLENLISARGLHALVKENSSNLSGGEKQRLNIARALIQNTPILILDEATAALDETTEANLIHHLRQLDKTIIFVAHRLPSIKHCDQIFTLSDGKILSA